MVEVRQQHRRLRHYDSQGPLPILAQRKTITITAFELYAPDVAKHHPVGNQAIWDAATADLADTTKRSFAVTAPQDPAGPTRVLVRSADTQAFLLIRYSLG